MPTRIAPYLHFTDTAREALAFYRGVFGGSVTVRTFGDFGAAMAGPACSERIM